MLTIEKRPISALRPYEHNPRDNDDAVPAVAASIRQFGFRVPIVVDRDGVIVTGHTRWKAAKSLGLVEVPVVVADDLTPDQIRAFRIADNKTGEIAGWDKDLLRLELGELKAADVDLISLGFSPDELQVLMSLELEQGLTDPDSVPLPPSLVTRRGDLWILGGHRLLCGDSCSVEDVDRLLDGRSIQ